jgi:hypothetical protein
MIFAALSLTGGTAVSMLCLIRASGRWFTNPTISLAKLTAHQTEKGSAVNSVPGRHVFQLSYGPFMFHRSYQWLVKVFGSLCGGLMLQHLVILYLELNTASEDSAKITAIDCLKVLAVERR